MKEAYTRVGFEPLQKRRRKKKQNCFPPQFGDLLSNFDLCRTASFVKQAESVPDLHKAFVFYVLLISNLQLNWRVALGEETKLSTYKNISRCTLRHSSSLCRPFSLSLFCFRSIHRCSAFFSLFTSSLLSRVNLMSHLVLPFIPYIGINLLSFQDYIASCSS